MKAHVRIRVPFLLLPTLIAVATILIVAWCVYLVASFGSRTEHCYHAIRLSMVVMEKYVQKYGKWPASWEELELVSGDGGLYSWPRDSAEIQTHVQIDFTLTLEEVANQEPDCFDAIKPIGPVWQYREYSTALLKAVRSRTEDVPQDP